VSEPSSSRPYMPGYGILPADEGGGLLPWSWAEERLRRSRNYWLASRWPDGRPHVLPVWGVWHDGCFWFSSSRGSRKARNLRRDGRCAVTTEEAHDPVMLDGVAELITGREDLERLLRLENEKYGTSYGMEMLDPEANSAFRVRPTWAFGLRSDDFQGSPTRWRFEAPGR
jgi:nitroimidazol reductase NimA-like FMN-containing flavoprotein (pyridoxamine 5'-phosphate oxidase superfamily)